MTLYAPTSVPAVAFNPEVGGCGKTHERAAKATHLAVSCELCEPLIVKHMDGWGASPEEATLTDTEAAVKQREQERGQALMNAAGSAMGEKFAELASQPKPRTRKAK